MEQSVDLLESVRNGRGTTDSLAEVQMIREYRSPAAPVPGVEYSFVVFTEQLDCAGTAELLRADEEDRVRCTSHPLARNQPLRA